jgi:hypothetical protein
MFTLRWAHSVTISLACFLVPTNMIFLPLRAIAFSRGSSFLQVLCSFIEINDVNAFLLSEDVRQHLWVPLLPQVTKVYTGFQELLLQ